jgi:TetR/AcrR family transcriptional regulator
LTTTLLDSLLPPRRERGGEATRKRILDAAEHEFAAKGFDGARLAAIARGADVQQALIHHYFDGKEGLHRAVIERALTSITTQGWQIIDRLAPPRRRTRGKRFGRSELEAFLEAMVGVLVDFYASHVRVLRILQHESARGGALGPELLRVQVAPQIDDVVERFEGMRARGEIRADVDARQMIMSAIAMASFPYLEEAFVAAVWGLDPHDGAFIAQRKREIVVTIMARVAP